MCLKDNIHACLFLCPSDTGIWISVWCVRACVCSFCPCMSGLCAAFTAIIISLFAVSVYFSDYFIRSILENVFASPSSISTAERIGMISCLKEQK